MPNALPSAVKKLRGTVRPCRVRNEAQPKTVSSRVPRGLPDCARPFWRKLAPKLARLGLLTELDVLALSELCLCLGRAAQADADIEARGLLVPGDRGMVKNPSAQLSRDYGLRGWALAGRFGLTPQDRVRVPVPEPQVEDLNETLERLVASAEYADLQPPDSYRNEIHIGGLPKEVDDDVEG